MAKRVVVLLGAGASWDVHDGGLLAQNGSWRPPLARELFLFNERPRFHDILLQYPQLTLIAVGLADRARRGALDLEKELRNLSEHRSPRIRSAFKRVAPYLRDVLANATWGYARVPGTYLHFIRRLIADHDHKVAFVSLNYDCLLELALQTAGWQFTDMIDYTNSAEFLLIKPHGSINWFYTWPTQGTWDDKLDSLSLEELRRPRIEFAPINAGLTSMSHTVQPFGNVFTYPALTAPLAGKDSSHFVCPPHHVTALKTFLDGCHKLLVAGTSAYDGHVLEVLGAGLSKLSEATIVTDRHDPSIEKRVIARIPSVASAKTRVNYVEGFRKYVMESAEFDAFLET